jgi:hypothetical protein
MTIQSIRRQARWRLPAATLLILGGALLAGTSFARVAVNTIDPVAVVSVDGRNVVLTGPLACDQNQTADLRVTLTQRTTGAVASGRIFFPCSTTTQQWEVEVRAKGRESFAPGEAAAVALARTVIGGGASDDAHQWLVNIILVSQ